jgi:hypothetical protein
MPEQGAPVMNGPGPKVRALWLLACLAVGAAVGIGGHWFTGSAAWFLAVPAALACGWWFFADPTQCLPRERR